METILELLKLDLGITHNERDTYFNALICTAVKELKARGIDIDVNVTDTEEDIKSKALSEENIIRHTEGKEIVKFIVIKDKIVNIVVK